MRFFYLNHSRKLNDLKPCLLYPFEIIVPIPVSSDFVHLCFINYPAYIIASFPSACRLNQKVIGYILSAPILALLNAVGQGHLKVVESLLAGGARIDEVNKNGRTALMYAAHSNHPDIVRLLVSKGADINLKNKYGNSARYYADEFGYSEIIQILKEAGAKK